MTVIVIVSVSILVAVAIYAAFLRLVRSGIRQMNAETERIAHSGIEQGDQQLRSIRRMRREFVRRFLV